MSADTKTVLQHLRQQLSGVPEKFGRTPAVMPVVEQSSIDAAEAELGFSLPPILKTIYLEIGNGGYFLGPASGLWGLSGGYDNFVGKDIIQYSKEFGADLEWWENILVLSELGCCDWDCVDCSDSDFPVYTWHGYDFNEETDFEEPSEHLWYCHYDTIEEWLMTPNSNKKGFEEGIIRPS